MTDTSPGADGGTSPGADAGAPPDAGARDAAGGRAAAEARMRTARAGVGDRTGGSAADPAPGTPDGSPRRPRLRRSRRYKVVGGVCGGLGQYFGMDPVIFRVVLGVLTATGGLGLVAYGFAWLLMPLDGEDDSEGRRLLSGRVEGSALTALLFAIVGCGLFLSVLNSTDTHFFAALLLLCLGGAAYWSHHRREAEELAADGVPVDDATAHAVADAPPETAPPPVPYSPSWWRDPLTKDGDFPPYLWGPDDGAGAEDAAPGGPPGAGFRPQKATPSGGGRDEHEAAGIGGWTFLAAAGTCAVVIGATWGAEPLGTTLAYGLGSALAVFGAGFTLSAWIGRTGGGTAFWALLTTVLLAVALWLPDTITADWGTRNWQPAAAADVRDRYELGSGEARLDLSRLDLDKGRRVETAAQVGLGQLTVRVPDDVRVEVHSRVDIGDMQLPPATGSEDPGDADIDVSPRQERTTVLEPTAGGSGGPKGTLVLDLTVSIGQLEVQRAAS
ncbi:PspC domain-containing protein [Streptomyces sp. NBC_01808]|uniref:PspC domain-containing protein n=1 Tax=Streptomyces sp. NBC_01808 TaxID=2975947 RepID=UPI002DDA5882|nr:PspC domain-containing protein [Streptomyces sp. NBC_01808]WSA39974.1 PspC domain-containing protein [Streptomyces sp. NBC_01808]